MPVVGQNTDQVFELSDWHEKIGNFAAEHSY
jgi:hypothetical protein